MNKALFLVGLLFLSCAAPVAADGRVFRCATSAEVHAALQAVGPGDTVLLEGGRVYETDASFMLSASGTVDRPIRFTSEDPAGQGRFAVITTVGGRKEPNLVGLSLRGAWWLLSRIEIAGSKVPLAEGYWDTHGFRLGLYLQGAGSHHNRVEDLLIHHTHNAAVAVRDDSHDNEFRRMRIHDIGEWLDADYNAHEGEGFYLGSSKSLAEAGNNARIRNILIEDSVLGPGLLGQFVDIKYAATGVTVRNNVFHCGARSYNEEIIKLAGFGNRVENNRFTGDHQRLARYIHVSTKKTDGPVRVNYRGETDIPAPSGKDNTIVDNVFQTNSHHVRPVEIDVADEYRPTVRVKRNRVECPKDSCPKKR